MHETRDCPINLDRKMFWTMRCIDSIPLFRDHLIRENFSMYTNAVANFLGSEINLPKSPSDTAVPHRITSYRQASGRRNDRRRRRFVIWQSKFLMKANDTDHVATSEFKYSLV